MVLSNHSKKYETLAKLPPQVELESKLVLKKTATAHRYLAELKGISSSIPNQNILINTLALQEAKDSSAIENIITTQDDLFKGEIIQGVNSATKEVRNYVGALRSGYQLVKKTRLLSNNHILVVQSTIESNNAGFRKLPGTELKNVKTGATIYVPPQDEQEILSLMKNLEQFINDDQMVDLDPLVKMAIIHYQFESIHPFYDGNGRTGRILNILYLVHQGLLDIPVLYLSRYIVDHKNDYYRLLQGVRDNQNWEDWILYMLEGVEKTAIQTIEIVKGIKLIMMDYKKRIRESYRFYSQDLLNNLFFHPYTKIEFLVRDIKVTRLTATKYLDELATDGFLKKERIGRANYYVNVALVELLSKN